MNSQPRYPPEAHWMPKASAYGNGTLASISQSVAQGDDIVPIPGTRRVVRVEGNMAADGDDLSQLQIDRLNSLTPAAGDRHDAANIARIEH